MRAPGRRAVLLTVASVAVLAGLVAHRLKALVPRAPARLILATTTSTADSGLLNYLLPAFEERYRCKVDVIAVGSGQAMKLGEDGNCDVLLVHSPEAERRFVAAGHGTSRLDVMYNDFVIVGPASDPARVSALRDAALALTQIADAGARFISRGDDSGTHVKELAIWERAGLTPGGSWYVSAGQGMGAVLTMASEQQAYTLSDRATYLAQRNSLQLVVLVEGDEALRNPYTVIAVNPEEHPGVNAALAASFQEWLTSLETQERIAGFGREEFGQSLFTPDSQPWREAHQ
ncbi:MAG: substrate-binding domain-containing protein [Anaerolineae bacterium]|nr:substrate-binding domain-containing protein [Anaerolineae bacterium]